MRNIIIGLISLLTVLVCSMGIAGRPVFQDYTIEQLVENSHLVAIVEKRKPFAQISIPVAGGCKEVRWPFQIKEVLNQQTALENLPPRKAIDLALLKKLAVTGKKIDVEFNEVSTKDCIFRIDNLSGYSFPSERYTPITTNLFEKKNTFIAFMVLKGKSLTLTTMNSIESSSQKNKVLEIARKLRSAAVTNAN